METSVRQSSDNSTHISEKANITNFCNEIYYLVWLISKQNLLTIGEDMNTPIDKNENNFFLHNIPKRNGEYRAEFFLDNSLQYLNAKYKNWNVKLSMHKITTENNSKARWDNIFLNKK